MATIAITPEYRGLVRDQQQNYGDNIILYVGWDEHLLFCSAKAFLIHPTMSGRELIESVLTEGFSQHPDFEKIDWDTVLWRLNNETFHLDQEISLSKQGVDHKSLLRFKTPGLSGYNGSGV